MCLLLDTQQKVRRRRRRLSSSLMGLTGVGTFARRYTLWLRALSSSLLSELSVYLQGACAENFQSLTTYDGLTQVSVVDLKKLIARVHA